MTDAAALAQQLSDLLELALGAESSDHAGRSPIADLARRAHELLDDIRGVHLPERATVTTQLTAARRTWLSQAAGSYGAGSDQLERQITVSPTLQALHRSGITITSARRYTGDDRRLAVRLGDRFAGWHDAWDGLKVAMHFGDRQVRFRRKDADDELNFVRAMVKDDVIRNVRYEVYTYRNKRHEPIAANRIRRLRNPEQPLRYHFELGDSDRARLLQGYWFNVYAGHVIADHLKRNDIDFELYTEVGYTSPADVMRASGDFDVLARANGTVVMLECKSGRLQPERGDLHQVVDRAVGLRRVLDVTNSGLRCEVMLLHNHHLNDAAELEAALSGTPVRLLRLDELRGAVIDAFAHLR